jgi:uncharacterized integral membrane protein
MKILISVLSVIAFVLAIFNATKLDLDSPFTGDSKVAIITILASLCALLLLQILRISRKIDSKYKQQ